MMRSAILSTAVIIALLLGSSSTAGAQTTITKDGWKFSITPPKGWRHVGLRLQPQYEELSDDIVLQPLDAASLQRQMFIMAVPRLVTSYSDAAALMEREGASVGKYRPLSKLEVSKGAGHRVHVRSYVSTNQRPLRIRICAVLSDGKEALYIEGGMIRGGPALTQKLAAAVSAVLSSYRGLGKTERNVKVEGYIQGSWTYINSNSTTRSIHGGVIAFDGKGQFRAAASGFSWAKDAGAGTDRSDATNIRQNIRRPGNYVVIGKTLILNYGGRLIHYRLDYCNSGIWLHGRLFAR